MRPTQSEVASRLSRTLQRWGSEEWADEQGRNFSADERRQLAKEGKALPDGSFPIVTAEDVSNAVRLARTPSQRAHVKKRARAIGASSAIPDEWSAVDSHDVSVQRAIEDAIGLQESDPDKDAQDSKVLGLLKQALAAQKADTA